MADELIVVVRYDPEWQHRFAAERALLERVLTPWLKEGIHHVGATAVPGLAAKPIIDMMAGVGDIEERAPRSIHCANNPTNTRLIARASHTTSLSRRRDSRK